MANSCLAHVFFVIGISTLVDQFITFMENPVEIIDDETLEAKNPAEYAEYIAIAPGSFDSDGKPLTFAKYLECTQAPAAPDDDHQQSEATVLSLPVKLLTSSSKLPTRGTAQSAGLDLYAAEDGVIEAGDYTAISTGVAVQLPQYSYGQIACRSGLARDYGLFLAAGIIDSDYTGEISVILHNTRADPYHYAKGDRIGQLIVLPYLPVVPIAVTDLPKNTHEGFGSTGK